MKRRVRLHLAQWVGALMLTVGLVLLATNWFAGSAGAAAGGRDQITGVGNDASAVTENWADGITGADNKTIVAPRVLATDGGRTMNSDFYNGTYDEYKNLQVTVNQTQNLVHQAIAVSWSGGPPTPSANQGDYLQMMECYGDADTGPNPEDCEYGSVGFIAGGSENAGVGTRSGNFCFNGNDPGGCDPLEHLKTHEIPGSNGDSFTVPLTPVGTSSLIYGGQTDPLTNYYDQFTSNEVQRAPTGAQGTGLYYFSTLTGVQAPALGCGEVDGATGQPRGCWLVIVPRGEYKTNGSKIEGTIGGGAYLNDTPLGASNWAMRMQIHLGFAPAQQSCPIGSADERQTVGTELASIAVRSWQLQLNQLANCKTLYGYTATPEATQTTQLEAGAANGATGLAFTNIPIGSEAGRESGQPVPSPVPVAYAPVAVSAMTLSFNVNLTGGYRTAPIKLTPRLVAKALTQSYLTELPEYVPSIGDDAPSWAIHNPDQLTQDPEFQALNPDIGPSQGAAAASAVMLTEDHSALNQEVWQWVLNDPVAKAWLQGAPDQWGMVVNPAYADPAAVDVAVQPLDSFPRADQSCVDVGAGTPQRPSVRCSLDLLPYLNDYDDTAVHLRSANSPSGTSWDPTKLGADGLPGSWAAGGLLGPGTTFLWGITDSAENAEFGLVAADLCDASGQNCVSPTAASVSAALASASPDSSGLLHVDPTAVPAGAYPLVNVTYAAVRTDDDPAAISDYASLISYATTAGQTPGDGPGQLPSGYLPLPDPLKAQSAAVVSSLEGDAGPTGQTQSPPPATTDQDNDGAGTTFNDTGGGDNDGAASTSSQGGGVAAAATTSPGPAAVSTGSGFVKPTLTAATPAPSSRYIPIGLLFGGALGLVGIPLSRRIGLGRGPGAQR
jgi:hypothetical protein